MNCYQRINKELIDGILRSGSTFAPVERYSRLWGKLSDLSRIIGYDRVIWIENAGPGGTRLSNLATNSGPVRAPSEHTSTQSRD